MTDAPPILRTALHLAVRTPQGLLLEQPVDAITAEDRSGWFGIRPGRTDLIALLPPGLLMWRDATGEGFVALFGGILSLTAGQCRVLAPEAVLSRDLDEVAQVAAEHVRRRRERADTHRGVVDELAKHALVHLVRTVRP